MTLKTIIEQTDKEFDKEHYNSFISVQYAEDCKSFLHESQLRLVEGIRDEVEKMYSEADGHLELKQQYWEKGSDEAISNILSLLDEVKK